MKTINGNSSADLFANTGKMSIEYQKAGILTFYSEGQESSKSIDAAVKMNFKLGLMGISQFHKIGKSSHQFD